MNIMQAFQNFSQNPAEFLIKSKYNIPNNIDIKNPQNIIQHLLNTNQLSQQQLMYAQNIFPQFQQMLGNKG